jgi:hypothetical protein
MVYLQPEEIDELRVIAARRLRLNYLSQPLASALIGHGAALIFLHYSLAPGSIPWVGLAGCVFCGVGLFSLLLLLLGRRRDYARAREIVRLRLKPEGSPAGLPTDPQGQ